MKYDLLQIARSYLRAAEKPGQDQAEFYAPNIQQTEYPNRLNTSVTVSDHQTLLQRSEQGKKILVNQSYEIKKDYVCGNTVILEVVWKGTFSIPIGETPPGRELRAYFAMFIEFEGDRIIKQRNYDCFEPF